MVNRNLIFLLITAAATMTVVILVVYLTPLKWLNLREPDIKDILPSVFYEQYQQDSSRYVFVDVRPAEQYNASHASGSVNIPLHLLYDERHSLPKHGKTIVLICGGGRASGVGYSYLEHFGFLNLRRISGGIEAWQKAGLPTESDKIAP